MTTKNLVPRASGQGQIGTSAKKWSQANFVAGSFDSLTVGGSAITAASDIEGVTAGNGLSGGGTAGTVSLALDLNELVAAAVDVASDSIAIIDADASNGSRKESIVDLVSAMAGSGLSASAGQLSVSGGSLASLSDTDVSSPGSGHILVYDGTDSFDNVALIGDATLATNGTLTLSSSATPTFAGLNMSNNKITSLATPILNNDAANKSYVDSVAQGLDVQPSVKLRLTGISGWSSGYTNGSTHQSVTLSTGDRIITDSSIVSQSGIFIVQASGEPTRPSNFDTGHEAAGTFVFVEEGTYADKGFVCTNNSGSDVVGTHGLTFTQFTQINLTSGSGVNVDSTDIDLYAYSLTAINNETSGSAIDSGDYLIVHDMSDSSQSGNGSTRKIQWQYLKNQIIDYAYSSNDLNIYNRKIYTTSNNGSITLDPNGTGKVRILGNQDSSGTNPAGIQLASENNQYSVTINSPTNSQYSSSSYNLTLPGNAGSADQVLKTDGNGALSWVDQSSGGGGSRVEPKFVGENTNQTSFTIGTVVSENNYMSTPVAAYNTSASGDVVAETVVGSSEIERVYVCKTGLTSITLPTSVGLDGFKVQIKRIGSTNITINTNGSETIDGDSTKALDIQYASLTLISDNVNWYVI